MYRVTAHCIKTTVYHGGSYRSIHEFPAFEIMAGNSVEVLKKCIDLLEKHSAPEYSEFSYSFVAI